MPLKRQNVPKSDGKPGRSPMWLSAFVMPGAGQCAQRRWVVGLLFAAAFILCFVVFMVFMALLIVPFYSMAFNFDTYEPPEVSSMPKMGAAISFLAAIGVYVVSLVDTSAAHRRQCSAWSAQKHGVEEFVDS